MKAAERREQLKKILTESSVPVSGSALAKILSVSRQVIVTDIALLRAEGEDILSTSQGYVLSREQMCKRIFKVHHAREDCEAELNIFVDCGAIVKDVFVSHRAYGVLRGELDIRSRLDVQEFLGIDPERQVHPPVLHDRGLPLPHHPGPVREGTGHDRGPAVAEGFSGQDPGLRT